MPAISFRRKFAGKVETGQKNHTIREPRKRPIQVGDTLYLYCEQRAKTGYLIGETVCTKIEKIHFGLNCDRLRRNQTLFMYTGEGFGLKAATPEEIKAIALADGFEDLDEFIDFFFHGWEKTPLHLPRFHGHLIHWEPLTKAEEAAA